MTWAQCPRDQPIRRTCQERSRETCGADHVAATNGESRRLLKSPLDALMQLTAPRPMFCAGRRARADNPHLPSRHPQLGQSSVETATFLSRKMPTKRREVQRDRKPYETVFSERDLERFTQITVSSETYSKVSRVSCTVDALAVGSMVGQLLPGGAQRRPQPPAWTKPPTGFRLRAPPAITARSQHESPGTSCTCCCHCRSRRPSGARTDHRRNRA